jgi:hypothetical protein
MRPKNTSLHSQTQGILQRTSLNRSSVSGGKENKATGEEASVSGGGGGGGGGGEATGPLSSIVGGRLGKAGYRASTVLGELEEVTEKELGITP